MRAVRAAEVRAGLRDSVEKGKDSVHRADSQQKRKDGGLSETVQW